jgi:hypothetical protein
VLMLQTIYQGKDIEAHIAKARILRATRGKITNKLGFAFLSVKSISVSQSVYSKDCSLVEGADEVIRRIPEMAAGDWDEVKFWLTRLIPTA